MSWEMLYPASDCSIFLNHEFTPDEEGWNCFKKIVHLTGLCINLCILTRQLCIYSSISSYYNLVHHIVSVIA